MIATVSLLPSTSSSMLIVIVLLALQLLQIQSFHLTPASSLLIRRGATHHTNKLNMLIDSSSSGIDSIITQTHHLSNSFLINAASDIAVVTDADSKIGYSNVSLYFTLGLYLLTLPGLYSLVTRSVKVKPTERIYDLPGPVNPTAKSLRQTAGEVMAYFKANNYQVTTAEDVIIFTGIMARSNSQAAFLTFCTFVGLASLGLVLSILSPDIIGSKAYLLTLTAPYAGIYYWNNAQREDVVKIKMETSDDDQTTSIIAQGGKEDLERFAKALLLPERGKVYVKGLFDGNE